MSFPYAAAPAPRPSGEPAPDPRLADVRGLLLEACREWHAERAHWPAFDEDDFRRRAIELAAASDEPGLQDAVWDYRDGKIDRFELRRHPAYRAAFARATAGVAEEWGDGRGAGIVLEALHTAEDDERR